MNPGRGRGAHPVTCLSGWREGRYSDHAGSRSLCDLARVRHGRGASSRRRGAVADAPLHHRRRPARDARLDLRPPPADARRGTHRHRRRRLDDPAGVARPPSVRGASRRLAPRGLGRLRPSPRSVQHGRRCDDDAGRAQAAPAHAARAAVGDAVPDELLPTVVGLLPAAGPPRGSPRDLGGCCARARHGRCRARRRRAELRRVPHPGRERGRDPALGARLPPAPRE